jgi:hypothetical protein
MPTQLLVTSVHSAWYSPPNSTGNPVTIGAGVPADSTALTSCCAAACRWSWLDLQQHILPPAVNNKLFSELHCVQVLDQRSSGLCTKGACINGRANGSHSQLTLACRAYAAHRIANTYSCRRAKRTHGKASLDVGASTVGRKNPFGPTVMSDQHFGALNRLHMSTKSLKRHGSTLQIT